MNMKKIFTLAAIVGTICSLASCSGKIDKPGEDKPTPTPEEKYVDGSTTIAGHEALDLGTDLLWATTNLGASAPQDYGKYYSWGEVEEKKEYRWGNYKWSDGFEPSTTAEYADLRITKYCMFKVYGDKDDKKVLEPEDDAATNAWGNGWRMPTKQEVDALLKNCEWEWNRVEGLYGYKISSKKTGKSIFLPAAGMIAVDGPHNSTLFCNYWTSSLFDQNEQYYAYSFVYTADGKEGTEYISNTYRYLGMTIRAVCDKPVTE